MFLTLLKRAVKAALHDAVDEWAFESGLPQKVIHEMRQKRQSLLLRELWRRQNFGASSASTR